MDGITDYVGIDFGTTNSATVVISSYERGSNLKRLEDSDGGPVPSLIVIDKISGKMYFGRDAWHQRKALEKDCEVITSVKRYLGTDRIWNISGKKYNAIKLTSEIFKNLLRNTREKLDCIIENAVIAVPAGFSSIKRLEVKKAAEMAGFRVKSFISEPTAAYYNNYFKLKQFSKIAVFDWGGGTLDISIIYNKEDEISELAIRSVEMGGDDIDEKIALWIHNQAIKQKGINRNFEEMNPALQDMLLNKSETAKRSLSESDKTSVSINEYGDFGAINIKIDIDTFSNLIKPEIKRAIETLENSVSDANLSMSEIDCIFMVGGSSNLTPLLDAIQEKWSKNYVHFPDESDWYVAEGAAVLNRTPGKFKMNQDIGLVLCDGYYLPLMKKNDFIPSELSIKEFGIVEDKDMANFVFSDRNMILGSESVPVYGFSNENIEVSYRVDEDLVFKAVMKSDHRTKKFTRIFEHPDIIYNYQLPR